MSYHKDDSQEHYDVRWRLLAKADKIVVVCVQGFDYPDYNGVWGAGWWDTEREAQWALVDFLYPSYRSLP